jgi:3'(2'), 5'-bisphosphate nucleotidase
MTDYSHFLPDIIRAVIAAGKAVLEVYETSFEVLQKSDHSPLTKADTESNRILCEALRTTAYPIISEEGDQMAYAVRSQWPVYWLIDPLDGTKEFVHRNGEFTVNVALIVEGLPVLGVVYAPVSDELYAGINGRGWWYMETASGLRPEALTDLSAFRGIPAAVSDVYRIVISRSHTDANTAAHIETRRAEKGGVVTVQAGSSMKLCLVAHGKADEYPRFGPTMEWDIAAGHAVLLGARKNVYNHPGGDVLQYNKLSLTNGPFIAR